METEIFFKIQSLIKIYDKKPILNIESLDFKKGQFVALMGKNGSGKSTLMRLVAQQETFESGDIKYKNQTFLSTKTEIKPYLAFISEDSNLPFPEPLNFWKDKFKNIYKNFDLDLFQKLTKSLEVDPLNSFHSMSRGQKMKAIFCLQAAKRPEIYILDEITSVLDSGSRWSIMEFLAKEAKRGCLVTMSTNIAEEMQGFATDLIFLDKGSIIFNSSSQNLETQFRKIRINKKYDLDFKTIKTRIRKIGFNSDNTFTYLHFKDDTKEINLPEALEDQRQITIADLLSFFTAGGDL